MNHSEESAYRKLLSAVERWRAKVGGSYYDFEKDLISELEACHRTLRLDGDRDAIVTPFHVSLVKQPLGEALNRDPQAAAQEEQALCNTGRPCIPPPSIAADILKRLERVESLVGIGG